MSTKKISKLSIGRETLRNLVNSDLERAQGGNPYTCTAGTGIRSSCSSGPHVLKCGTTTTCNGLSDQC